MAMAKRIFLFIAVNLLVVLTISITLNVLGIRPYLSANGIDYQALLAFCAVWGFVGAGISLAISRIMAKWSMGVKLIDESSGGEARQLYATVQRLSQKANLPMPQVGIYQSPEVNAFATGPSKSRSLVAVSSGLLQRMDTAAVEGVLAHEVAHIANGDMVTMTLLQGIVNTFVMFFSRVAAWGVSQALSGNRDDRQSSHPGWTYYLVQFAFEILFSLLGMIVMAFYSRRREFRADKGGAQYAGREKMVHALQSLQSSVELVDDSKPSVAALKISGRKGFLALLSTHPPLETRIAALRNGL